MEDNEELNRLCRDCGFPGPVSWVFCAHCGRRMVEQPHKVLRAIGYLLVGLLILVFGAFGTCFTTLGFAGGSGSSWGLLAGPALLALAVVCLIQLARSLRKF